MKKPLAIKLMVEEKTVRRALALLTGDTFPDEEMEKRYFSEPVEVDLEALVGTQDAFPMIAAFVGFMTKEE